jgi:AAA domain-containing protein
MLKHNPFEVMKKGRVFLPDPPHDWSTTSPLDVPLYPGRWNEAGRGLIIQGAPGVGKTHRLLHDLTTLNSLWGRIDKYGMVTSKNNATVNEANIRLERRYCTTAHALLWRWKGSEVGGQIEPPKKRGRPPYFRHLPTAQLRKQYVDDAGYGRKGDARDYSEAFLSWDPMREPLPDLLSDPSQIPSSCAFSWTALQICLDCEARFQAGRMTIPEGKFRGALLIDEAQDIEPLLALALGWFALEKHLEVRCYGDPNQMLDQDRELPFLWDQFGEVEMFFGSDPKRRRVPLRIAQLAEKILPGRVPPAEDWANPTKPGMVIPMSCPNSEKLQTFGGFTVCESRWAVDKAMEFVAPGVCVALSEEVEAPFDAVISTAFMLKGHQSELVTIQRWKPKHLERYKEGDLQARRRLYVSVTRSMERLCIHEEMLEMIEDYSIL